MTAADLFTHNRIILGMIIGLGMTRILMTFANVIQNPQPKNRSSLHLLWLASIALELVIWWWWQPSLRYLPSWSFELVFFVTAYAVTIFMTAIMLAPDKVPEGEGYADFFMRRRHWFFAFLGATFIFDALDTVMKIFVLNEPLDWNLFIQVPIGLPLCILGWYTSKRAIQHGIVAAHIIYQLHILTYFSLNLD